jgi:hypothetical protein
MCALIAAENARSELLLTKRLREKLGLSSGTDELNGEAIAVPFDCDTGLC